MCILIEKAGIVNRKSKLVQKFFGKRWQFAKKKRERTGRGGKYGV